MRTTVGRSFGAALCAVSLLALLVGGTSPALAAVPIPLPSLHASYATVVEGDAGDVELRIAVALDRPALTPVTFDYATRDGAATEGADYDRLAGSATIASGEQGKTFDVVVHGDSLDEGDGEYLYFDVTSIVGATGDSGTSSTSYEQLVDDDAPSIPIPDLVVSTPTIVEGDAGDDTTLRFVAVLDRPAAQPVTFHYATQNYDATAGDDFDSAEDDATIAQGEQSTTVDVTVHGDAADEGGGEYVLLDLSQPVGATIFHSQASTTYGRIVDDDTPAVRAPQLQVSQPSVVEGDAGTSALQFVVALDRPADDDVTVDYTTGDGSATEADGDYEAVSGTLTIAAGEQAGEIDVAVHGDTTPEDDEYLYVSLSSPTGATFQGGSTASTYAYGLLLDDDGAATAAAPNIQPLDSSIVEGDAGTRTLHVPIALDRPAAAPVTIHANVTDYTLPRDFDDLVDAAVIIPAGQVLGFLDITVHGDTLEELGGEGATAELEVVGGDATFYGDTTGVASFTILDDDNTIASTPEITAEPASVVEGDAGTVSLRVPLVLDRIVADDVVVHATATDTDAQRDFNDLDATVTIPHGSLVVFVDVTVLGDTIRESSAESVYVGLDVQAGSARFPGADGNGYAYPVILDDDPTPVPARTLTWLPASVVEGDTGTAMLSVPLVLDRPAPTDVTVHTSATDDPSELDPRDFADLDATVTFAAGSVLAYAQVTVLGDPYVEGDEAVYVGLDGVTGDAQVPQGYEFVYGTILNDDDPGPGRVRFDSATQSVAEGAATADVYVWRDGGWTGAVSVDVSITGGTATAGDDYTDPGTVSLRWEDQEAGPQLVSIPLLGDTVVEGNETIVVSLAVTDGDAAPVEPTSTTITLLDDETPGPPVVDAGSDASELEGDPVDLTAASPTRRPPSHGLQPRGSTWIRARRARSTTRARPRPPSGAPMRGPGRSR